MGAGGRRPLTRLCPPHLPSCPQERPGPADVPGVQFRDPGLPQPLPHLRPLLAVPLQHLLLARLRQPHDQVRGSGGAVRRVGERRALLPWPAPAHLPLWGGNQGFTRAPPPHRAFSGLAPCGPANPTWAQSHRAGGRGTQRWPHQPSLARCLRLTVASSSSLLAATMCPARVRSTWPCSKTTPLGKREPLRLWTPLGSLAVSVVFFSCKTLRCGTNAEWPQATWALTGCRIRISGGALEPSPLAGALQFSGPIKGAPSPDVVTCLHVAELEWGGWVLAGNV